MSIPDGIRQDVELKPHTWMKVGGKADYFAEVRTKEELLEAFAVAKEKKLPILYLGQGSNLIISDEGFRGVVIHLVNDQVKVDSEYSSTEALVSVEGGKILSRLIHELRKQGLNGLDNFVGIPGVVGSAVRGNIGIPQEEFGELVKNVEIFDGKSFRTFSQEACEFSYRGSKIKNEYWLLWKADVIVRKGAPPKKDKILLSRIAKQPKGHSCGSFFKNPVPKEIYAGKVIEDSGLKGLRKGGAFISEKHANFLMNDGTATAHDIVEVARQVKREVLARKGIVLENEVLLYDQWGKEIKL